MVHVAKIAKIQKSVKLLFNNDRNHLYVKFD